MLLYESLLMEAEKEGIVVHERNIGNFKGLYVDGNIALNTSIETYSEKACILAEELGHHHTSCGNIVNQSIIENRKQERKARAWAYEKLIKLSSLIYAYKKGIRNKYELAEYLGVCEYFIDNAIQYYKEKYGLCHKEGDYVIYFDPLTIFEKAR